MIDIIPPKFQHFWMPPKPHKKLFGTLKIGEIFIYRDELYQKNSADSAEFLIKHSKKQKLVFSKKFKEKTRVRYLDTRDEQKS